MRIGSLFAGIGGLELGLERAGVGHTVWQVEKDPYCRQVLARHWPDATRYEDVTTVDWSTVEPVEVLCGGFPCQPVSEAGNQLAQADPRWLWPEYARAVRSLRPRFVVVENVTGLLTANNGRAMGEVVGDLSELGYVGEWSVLSACRMGAPHSRERVFLLAHDDRGGQQAGRDRRSGEGPRMAARWVGEEHLPPAPVAGDGTRGRAQWAREPGMGRVADGLSPGLDRSRLRALGNAVVPQVAEVVGRRIIELDGYRETR